MQDKEKHIALIDSTGRNIIGKLVSETEQTLTINNPVILFANPKEDGQLHVQSFQLFFSEFIDKEHRDSNNWTYTKSAIVQSSVVLDERILKGYKEMNTPKDQVAAAKSPKVISIDA